MNGDGNNVPRVERLFSAKSADTLKSMILPCSLSLPKGAGILSLYPSVCSEYREKNSRSLSLPKGAEGRNVCPFQQQWAGGISSVILMKVPFEEGGTFIRINDCRGSDYSSDWLLDDLFHNQTVFN